MSECAFEATYSDFKLVRSRKCVQIVLEVPLEKANIALTALGGMPDPASEKWVAVARLNPQQPQEETGTETAQQAPAHKEPARARNRLSQRAGILCNDPLFQRFLNEESPVGCGPVIDTETAAAALRQICKVESRKDILPGTDAATRLDFLESAYVGWRERDAVVEASLTEPVRR